MVEAQASTLSRSAVPTAATACRIIETASEARRASTSSAAGAEVGQCGAAEDAAEEGDGAPHGLLTKLADGGLDRAGDGGEFVRERRRRRRAAGRRGDHLEALLQVGGALLPAAGDVLGQP